MISPLRLAGTMLKTGVTTATTGVRVGQTLLGRATGRGQAASSGTFQEQDPIQAPMAPTPAPVGPPGVDEVKERARAAAQAELARAEETVVEVNALDLVEAAIAEPVADQVVYSTDTVSGSSDKTSASMGGASGP